MMLPKQRHVTRSEVSMISFMSWATTRTVTPFSLILRMASCTALDSDSPIHAVGSSSNRSLGSVDRARQS